MTMLSEARKKSSRYGITMNYRFFAGGDSRSVGQLGLAGIDPGGQPVGANVGGGIGQLLDQRCRRQIVKAVVVFVGVGGLSALRITIRKQQRFHLAMRGKAGIEGVIRGIADEGSVMRADREKGAETVNQRGVEPLIDPLLTGGVPVIVFGGIEWIVGFGHEVREKSRVHFRVFPFAALQ